MSLSRHHFTNRSFSNEAFCLGDPPGPGAYIELRVGSGPSLHGTHPTPRWGRGQISAASFCHKVNAEVMTDEEREMRAGREKNKGNKAFKAGEEERRFKVFDLN